MSERTEEEEQFVRQMTARGVRGLYADEWSPQLALDIVREQRRRYAKDPLTQVYGRIGTRLAAELQRQIDVSPGDIAKVLLCVTGKLATLALGDPPFTGIMLMEVANCAADDLDQAARAGETS